MAASERLLCCISWEIPKICKQVGLGKLEEASSYNPKWNFKAVGDEEMEEKFAKPKLEPIIYVVSKGLRACFLMVIDLLKKWEIYTFVYMMWDDKNASQSMPLCSFDTEITALLLLSLSLQDFAP